MPQAAPGSMLATLLFTDIVGSSDLADQLGDRRWREVLARHHALVRRQLKRFNGRELDTAGDGFFAAFTKPAEGIRCAAAISDSLLELGIQVRAGLHVGEAEIFGSKLSGLTVHIAARTMGAAGPGDVLVTGVLRDLVPGSGFGFLDRGPHGLKGIPGEWRLFAVVAVDGHPRAAAPDREQMQERLAAIEPPRIPRRARLPLVAGVAALVIAAIVLLIVVIPGGSPSTAHSGSAAPAKGQLVVIDQISRERTFSVPLDFTPGPIAFNEGSVWILDRGGNGVVRVNAVTRRVQARIRVGKEPVAIAVGGGSVWVANEFDSSVTRIDPGTDRVTATIDLGFQPLTVAAGDQAVWAAAGATVSGNPPALSDLAAIDPRTNRASEPTKLRSGLGCAPFLGAASGEGLAATAYGEVWKLDPHGAEPTRLLGAPRALAGIFSDQETGTVWFGNDGYPGNIVPLDLATRRLGTPIPVGTTGNQLAPGEPGGPGCNPVWIARGGDYLWVTNSDDRSITVIPAVSLSAVGTVPLDGRPVGLASGVDQVWVAVDLG
ncbi:MAG: hypothetical protein E6G44_03050 [Actinobacteria bacterium]|nr:MAG: hypothetical protein E6G44_03050 [Actinomycetota bacterium]